MNLNCLVYLFLVHSSRVLSKEQQHIIPSEGPLIIDTDAGIDDALAVVMMLNAHNFQLKAITCVRGSTNVFNVAINVQKVLTAANRSGIPLYVGADFGLIHTMPVTGIFGNDGFGDLNEDGVKMTNLAPGHAAVAMAKMVTENPGNISILCLGPLTNLALACHIQPQFLRLAKSVFVYGGTCGISIVTPKWESNFYMDPEAAHIVFKRALVLGRRIIVLPMDIVPDFKFDKGVQKQVLGRMKSPQVKLLNRAYDMLEITTGSKDTFKKDNKIISGDFYAAAFLLNPEAECKIYPIYMDVDTHGSKTKSITIVDFTNLTSTAANAYLISSAESLSLDKAIIAYIQ